MAASTIQVLKGVHELHGSPPLLCNVLKYAGAHFLGSRRLLFGRGEFFGVVTYRHGKALRAEALRSGAPNLVSSDFLLFPSLRQETMEIHILVPGVPQNAPTPKPKQKQR